jgi:hypothetical protein
MLAYRLLVPALALAISAPAAAQNEVPAALRNLKPHQIVEAVMSESKILGLEEVQIQWLDSLHLAILKEPHRYVSVATDKPISGSWMSPMVSRKRAYAEALSILTKEQRAQAQARFNDAGYRLPAELQTPAAGTGKPAADPLRHEATGATPTRESTKPADSAKDPLQHRGGERPSRETGDSGKPTNPITHRP